MIVKPHDPVTLPGFGRTGLFCGAFRPSQNPDGIKAALAAEQMGWPALWIAGGIDGELAISDLWRLLRATRSATVCLGVLSIWAIGPRRLAEIYAELSAQFPERFVLALGVSHPESVGAIRRKAGVDDSGWRGPVSAMTAYLDALQQDLGEHPRRIMLGALGPRMTELAGQQAAGAYPYFVPVEHTGAARVHLGPNSLLAVQQAVLIDVPEEQVIARARQYMAYFLGLANYRAHLARYGYGPEDCAGGGTPRLINAMVSVGGSSEARDRVTEHRTAGADHVVVQPLATAEEGTFPLRIWERVLTTLAR